MTPVSTAARSTEGLESDQSLRHSVAAAVDHIARCPAGNGSNATWHDKLQKMRRMGPHHRFGPPAGSMAVFLAPPPGYLPANPAPPGAMSNTEGPLKFPDSLPGPFVKLFTACQYKWSKVWQKRG